MHAEPFLATTSPLSAGLEYMLAVAGLPASDMRPLSLSLHIPDFFAEADPDAAMDTYLSYLRREVTMHAVLLAGMCSIRQLNFDGAGAANVPERALDYLLRDVRRYFRFMDGEAGDYEAAVDAATLPPGRLRRLRERGFDRLRISFDAGGEAPERLALLVDCARAAGFRSVCVALIYGMPGQRFGRLRWMLETVLAAAPDRIVLCHHAGVHSEHPVPGSVTQRMQQLCADRLDMASFTHIGVGRYARLPGDTAPMPAARKDRSFPLLGCGLGAMSAIAQVACRNVTAVYDYYSRLDRNELPIEQLLRQEQTEPYLMQVKDFQDVDQ